MTPPPFSADQRRSFRRRHLRGMVIVILVGLAAAVDRMRSGKWDALIAAEYLISFIACAAIARISYRRFIRRMAEKMNYRMTENWRQRGG